MHLLDALSGVLFLYIWLFHNPIIGIVIYLLPSIIAFIRNTDNFWPQTIIGILLGWITPVWIIVLAWCIFGEKLTIENNHTE